MLQVGRLSQKKRKEDSRINLIFILEKARRLVDLCNTFHIPIVAFVDQPGFAVGSVAEKEG